LHATGLLANYRPIFHSMAQIQGFMTCFAVGFLFTMIPRRTGSAPPATWQVVLCAVAPVVTTAAAWSQLWVVSQVAWLALAVTLIGFAVSRFLSATSRRRPPNSFVWIPMSLAMGVVGSLLTAAAMAAGPEYFWLHDVGRGMILQGLFIGLVLGVGSLAFPLMTRGQAPSDAAPTRRDQIERGLHVLGGAVLVASFFVGALVSLRLGLAMRAAVIVIVLVGSVQLWRPPTGPGWNRRLIWLAGWFLPLGYVLAVVFVQHHKAGLHVAFIGGFALLAFAVSTQVTLGHRGYSDVMVGKPWQVPAIGSLMIAASAARFAMDFDPARFFLWMAVAAFFFLLGSAVWLAFVLPKMIVSPLAENPQTEGAGR
jgi:uncharacterized protein involved in response to NO